jgi:threonine/homoserine/homoserine lactone efflux protein
MPAPSTLALFALAALALIAIPGPNMVYVATRSISEGRRSGAGATQVLVVGALGFAMRCGYALASNAAAALSGGRR